MTYSREFTFEFTIAGPDGPETWSVTCERSSVGRLRELRGDTKDQAEQLENQLNGVVVSATCNEFPVEAPYPAEVTDEVYDRHPYFQRLAERIRSLRKGERDS